jgi:hypothetical protein
MNSTSAFWSRQLHFHIESTWQPSNPIERNAAPYDSKIAPEQRSGDDERKSDRGVQTTRQNPPRDSRPVALVAAGWHDPALRVASRGGATRLLEETALGIDGFSFLFQFGGLTKRHHVFLVDLPTNLTPAASNEISRCRWIRPKQVSNVITSVPTREIVRLLVSHKNVTIAVPAVDLDSKAAASA